MKIAIIEDRLGRLEHFTVFEIGAYPFVKLLTESIFDKLLNDLKDNRTEILDEFDCIASHRSAFSNELRDILKSYCRKNKKPLVFFSGGITASVYKDVNFPFLNINSKDFYSKNLKLFLETCQSTNQLNLLILQFGKQWKLALLLNLRNRIVVALNKQLIKNNNPSLEFGPTELISRVGDFKINAFIKSYLIDEQLIELLSGDENHPVTADDIKRFKDVLDRIIIDSL